MSPVINLGFVSIHLYSICLLIGVFLASYLIIKEGKRLGYKEDNISDLLFYAIIFGIVGARIYYCIFNFEYYSGNILDIFKVWEGGLAIHGGIIGGAICTIIYCKKKNYNFLHIFDIIVPGLILAQAIGRWGNFFNGEAHGGVTTLNHLQSLLLPKFIIEGMLIDGSYYLPTFLYESVWCLIGFFIMCFIRKRVFVKVGYLTSFYFIWYSIERFFVEGLRTDSLMLFSFKMAQFVSILMFVLGILIFIYSYRKSKKYNILFERVDDDD